MPDTSNLFLEDILELISQYGRPMMNQFAVSATPGHKAAGTWSCEVTIPPKKGARRLPPNEQHMHGGWRCAGKGKTPTEAARRCLASLLEAAESPDAVNVQFVSTADVIATETAKLRIEASNV